MFMMSYYAFLMAGLPHHYSQPSAAPDYYIPPLKMKPMIQYPMQHALAVL